MNTSAQTTTTSSNAPRPLSVPLFTLHLPIRFHPGNLRALRAAIAERVGFEHELFHQHDNQRGGYHWHYPLIQYSVRRGQIQIVGVGEGAAALREQLLPHLGQELEVLGERLAIPACTFRAGEGQLELLPEMRLQGLRNWLALNQDNYHAWRRSDDPATRRAILNRALTGHLRLLAKGLGSTALDQIHGQVLQIDQRKRVFWKGVPMIQFHAQIATNLHYPEQLNLGRLAAYGYGEALAAPQYRAFVKRLRGRRPAIVKRNLQRKL